MAAAQAVPTNGAGVTPAQQKAAWAALEKETGLPKAALARLITEEATAAKETTVKAEVETPDLDALEFGIQCVIILGAAGIALGVVFWLVPGLAWYWKAVIAAVAAIAGAGTGGMVAHSFFTRARAKREQTENAMRSAAKARSRAKADAFVRSPTKVGLSYDPDLDEVGVDISVNMSSDGAIGAAAHAGEEQLAGLLRMISGKKGKPTLPEGWTVRDNQLYGPDGRKRSGAALVEALGVS